MLSGFRKLFQSKIGLAITFLFIALIALAFAATDITGNTFGGVSGGDRVALVGDERVPVNELNTAAQNALDQLRQRNPTLTMPAFVEQGGLDGALDTLLDRYALAVYAEENGLRAGDNLVNSEIQKFPAFRNADGEVTADSFRQALSTARVSETEVRQNFKFGLLIQQLLNPAIAAPQMPTKVAQQYAALVTERRKGQVALLPSGAFAPDGDPSKEQLNKFYTDNKVRYVRPERRTIRYAAFGADKITASTEATPAEIKARYEEEPDRFKAGETRSVTAFPVPTREAADAIATRIRGGLSIEAAAQDAGFNVSKVEDQTREQLASSFSSAVAEAIFNAGDGQVAVPARSNLGFYVAKVDNVKRIGARSLAEATPELKEQLDIEKKANALADLSAKIENEFSDGTSIVEVAKKYDLDLVTSKPVLANGQIFDEPGTTLPEQLAPTLQTAFQMDEGEPQLTQLVPGERFLAFDVTNIVEAAAPPVTDIRDTVVAGWKNFEGSKEARKAADRVVKKVSGTMTLSQALDGEDGEFPGIQKVDLARQQLMAQQQRPAPPLVLMFSMAEGSTKVLEASNDQGWFIVDLDEIVAEPLEDDNPLLARTTLELAPALRAEYEQQLITAIREEVGIERNETAIEAVRKRLSGES
ncbi:MAG: peptidylprolyl isomerase [Erythrobacter sp.]